MVALAGVLQGAGHLRCLDQDSGYTGVLALGTFAALHFCSCCVLLCVCYSSIKCTKGMKGSQKEEREGERKEGRRRQQGVMGNPQNLKIWT